MIETLYAIPSYRCNLSCSHCDIRNYRSAEDRDAFMRRLQEADFRRGIIFGGEPLLVDTGFLTDICRTGKMRSISTNLLLLTRKHVELLQEHGIEVATSWNSDRFDDLQFETWLRNVELLVASGTAPTVLITLTESLFRSDVSRVLDRLDAIGGCVIKFEPYVPASRDLTEKSDIWLTRLSMRWAWPALTNQTVLDYANGNVMNCGRTWTLRPDGELVHSCPTRLGDNVMSRCFSCEYRNVCKPCRKQAECSFMKRLYQYAKTGRIW